MHYFTFLGFEIQVEKWSRWSPLKLRRSTKERVIDYGYWRLSITK